MNERIKELVKQAGGHFSTHTLTSYPAQRRESIELWDDKIEKFAELLVEEMYDFMCKATDNDGAWPSSKEVKQHFGVDGMSTEDKKTLIKELLGVKE